MSTSTSEPFKNFILLLNSNDDTSRTGTVQNSVYRINWTALIPREYQRRNFRVRFSFCSSASTLQSESYLLYASFGTARNSYNQASNISDFLGLIQHQSVFVSDADVKTFWSCGQDFNAPVEISYPQYGDLRIRLVDQAAPNVINMEEYVLCLSFELI